MTEACKTPNDGKIPLTDGKCRGRIFGGWANCVHGHDGYIEELEKRLKRAKEIRMQMFGNEV